MFIFSKSEEIHTIFRKVILSSLDFATDQKLVSMLSGCMKIQATGGGNVVSKQRGESKMLGGSR